ncbi:MAG: hypothetical protein K2K97_11300, partial [Muribaculaceae bacterium]|nr:hypothetical protein [Muribaculaceae bacterium]
MIDGCLLPLAGTLMIYLLFGLTGLVSDVLGIPPFWGFLITLIVSFVTVCILGRFAFWVYDVYNAKNNKKNNKIEHIRCVYSYAFRDYIKTQRMKEPFSKSEINKMLKVPENLWEGKNIELEAQDRSLRPKQHFLRWENQQSKLTSEIQNIVSHIGSIICSQYDLNYAKDNGQMA